MMPTREEISQAVQLYIENVKIKGDNNKVGTIGLDEEAVCKMLGDAVTSLSARIEENGQEVTEAIIEKLIGVIHSNMIYTVSELSDVQKVSEESIKKAIRQNFDTLTENLTDFVDRIFNEIQEIGQSISDLQNAIEQLSGKYEKQVANVLPQLRLFIEEEGQTIRETVVKIGEGNKNEVNAHTSKVVDAAKEEIIGAVLECTQTLIDEERKKTVLEENLDKDREYGITEQAERRLKGEEVKIGEPQEPCMAQEDKKNFSRYYMPAQHGEAWAQCGLGICYYNGHGVKQDYTEAVKWWCKSAEQGYALAQYNLGTCYLYGHGVKQDYHKAIDFFSKAAKQGLVEAQTNLGYCYEMGIGVEQNYTKAMKLFRKAAFIGEPMARNNLGEMYYLGWGVPQNYKKARKLFFKAAIQGCAESQYYLGECFYYGYGGTQDFDKAKQWYIRAALQEYAKAKETLNRLGINY